MLTHDQPFFEESFSWGFPALDLHLMVHIHETSVLMAPTDPWYTFAPQTLPTLSTEAVRRLNLVPTGRWLFWMPDTPADLYEWRPAWNTSTKKFQPLTSSQCPRLVQRETLPGWTLPIMKAFFDRYKDLRSTASWEKFPTWE